MSAKNSNRDTILAKAILAKAWTPALEQLEHRQLMAGSATDVQALPFRLDFDKPVGKTLSDRDGQGTGFTRVQDNKRRDQYQPGRIDLDTASGLLKLTTFGSSLTGSNAGVDNTLTNALETLFDGNQRGFTIETRLIGPLSFINDRVEQAGIYLGPDQDNFVKLVVNRNFNGQFLSFEDEFASARGGVTSTRNGTNAQTNIGSFASITTLDLRLVGDASTGKVSAYFRVNANSGAFTKVGYDITIAPEKRSQFFNSMSRAGILASHKSDRGAITANFDSFSITGGTAIATRPGISGVENLAANATGVRRDLPIRAQIAWPGGGRAVRNASLSGASVRLYETATGATVAAKLSVSTNGNMVVVQPTTLLNPNTTYTFEVTDKLTDTSGQSFQPFALAFSTGDESQASNVAVDKTALYFNDISMTASNGWGTSPSQTIRVRNTGVAPLVLGSNGLSFGGPNAGEFQLTTSISLPRSIEAGGYLDVPVVFNAAAVGIRAATLTINSNDPDTAAVVVTLRGLGTAGEGGNLEPSLQRILDLYQIPVNVGDPTPDTFDIPSPPTSGDAIDIERLRKAGTGPVTIEMLGNFANSVSPSSRFGYYTPGQIAGRKQLFTVSSANAQRIRPTIDGTLSFDPTGDFGIYGEFPAFGSRVVTSEKLLNTWESNAARQQKVRFFPLKNADGSVVPNAYVFTFEEYTVEFDQNDIVGIIRNVQPAAAGAEIGIQNLDTVPFPDRMVFSRVRENVGDPNQGYIANTYHDRSTLRITNTGSQNLVVSNVTLSNTDFIIESGGGAFTLTPGQTRDVVVKFVYDRTGTGNDVRIATLNIVSNDADEATKSITLAGLWQSYSENAPNGVTQEPTAQQILQTLGYNVNLGNLNTFGNPVRAGEEVLSEWWQRADGNTPVGVRQLAAYHQQKNNTNSHIRWLPDGVTGNGNFLFQHLASDGQSLLPRKNFSTDPAYGEFAPWNQFAWAIDSDWSIDHRNTNAYNPAAFPAIDGGHAMRFYAAKDASGNLIPNTYILLMDYVGQSFSNFDYQDNIYLLTNVKPFSGPLAPANANAAVSGAGVALSWSASTEGNLAGYNVYRATSVGGPYTKLNSALLTGTNYADASALAGTTYYYQVRGVDVHGTEGNAASLSTTRTSDTAAPATPANATAIGSTGSIAINWLDNVEADLAGYNVYRADSLDGPFVKLNNTPLGSSDYTDLSAPVAQTSYYRITAVDFSGNESVAATASGYRAASGAVPAAPSSLIKTATGATSVTLSWTDNASNETGFLIERQNPDGTFTQVGTVGANVTTFTDTGLTSGTTYVYRVRATNAVGPSAYSNSLSATTTLAAPAPATGLAAIALNANAVRLTWTDNATNEAGYRIERRVGTSGQWVTIDTVGTNITLYVDSTALANTSYGYRVVAFNTAGSAPATSTVTVSTPQADGYNSVDIGNPTPTGTTTVVNAGRDYDISAGGTDVWANSDQFRFVYRALTGDFDFSARVTDISQTDVGSMAGLMARESLNADSRHVYMRARSSGMRFNYREATGGASNANGNIAFSFPNAWVRLQRIGNVFTGFASTDGVTWTQVHQMTMALPGTLYFGMAVSARTTSGLATLAKVRDLTDRKASVAPLAPGDLVGSADSGAGKVTLNWKDQATTESGYRVERRLNGSAAWTTIATLGAGATSYADTTVSAGQSYVYRVVAINDAGEAASGELTMTVSSEVPAAPTGLTATNGTGGVALVWTDASSNESNFQVERRVDGSDTWTSIAITGANVTTYTDATGSTGVTYVYRVRALGSVGDSNYTNEATVTTPATLSFTSADIGVSGGSTQVLSEGDSYRVTSAGTDIWNTSDQFRFVYRQVTGDFDIKVRLDSIGWVNNQTMAGLMARASLDADSRNVHMKTRVDGSLRMTYRTSTAGQTSAYGTGTVAFPNAWLRLVRQGNTFVGYASADGVTWTWISQVTMSAPSTMYVGMAVTSHQTGVQTTAQFNDLTLTTP